LTKYQRKENENLEGNAEVLHCEAVKIQREIRKEK